MNITDIMIAKALSPQGQIESYAARARQAVQSANAAVTAVQSVASNLTTLAQDTQDINTLAQSTIQDLNDAIALMNEPLNEEAVDAEVKKLTLERFDTDSQTAKTTQLVMTYPDNTTNTIGIVEKLYKDTGANEDGSMTQKAITTALNTKADATTLNNYASKSYVDNAIAAIPSSGDSGGGSATDLNLGSENASYIVVVGDDGKVKAGNITEAEIIDSLIQSGSYIAKNALGLEIDYENKSFTRTQNATNLSSGADFNAYTMYGGRMRCNVADDGTINAFYGDPTYADDGSNGQVMIYQPKFYYQRTPLKMGNATVGKIVRHETLIISASLQPGFKLHPMFKTVDGQELDYVLLPAYDGSLNNNKLCSIAGAKPLSNVTLIDAETYANNRGTGWHIMNMAAESVTQMLEMIEFGTLNGQNALEAGITNITSISNYNCASLTGSTAGLGNITGTAIETYNDVNGSITTQTAAGKRAISYRGMENPWGNIWNMLGGINVAGNGSQGGGVPYICTDFNYDINSIGNNYRSVGFCLPSNYGWVSAMGYGEADYDWVYMPAECANTANSALPVGDRLWTKTNLNGIVLVAVGGSWSAAENGGPFYYGCDQYSSESSQHAYGVKLMYIPTKNEIYTSNYQKWLNKVGE